MRGATMRSMQQVKESSSNPALRGQFGIHVLGMSPTELDALPYGVIKLDRKGVVLTFNAHEERASHLPRVEVLGKRFFHDVAPCARVREFHGRFLEGVAQRMVDQTFGFVFPFPHGDRHVLVTLFYQAADESIWVIIRDTCAPAAG